MKNFSRSDRVSEQIRRDLADIIKSELKDPRVGMISLTAVELTPDYAHAKIFFTTLDISHLPEIQAGLRRASGFLRRELGRRVRIHTLPELHFIHDDSLERGASLSKLIDAAAALSRDTAEANPSSTATDAATASDLSSAPANASGSAA